MATTNTTSNINVEYLPIEFFFNDFEDLCLVTWMSDQVGCLRSVFKIYECHKRADKNVIYVGDARIQVIRTDFNKFDVESNDPINISKHEDKATCLFLKDGTVVIFICQKEGDLLGYHFCYEESSDGTFQEMIQSH
jgi:hypothetical protein